MRWSSTSLIVCVLLQGCYEPSELDYQKVCTTNDTDCLAQDNDGDGVKNGEDDFPFDRRCSVLDDENCSACGEGCESPLVCIKAERSCGEGEPMAGTPMAGTPMAGTPMAGTPMAGTPMAGTPMAGTPMTNDCDGSVDEDCISAELEFVNIPGGAFEMGSTASSDEQPIHTVTIPRFEITRTEVTVAQYRACVDAGVCSLPNTNYSTCAWSNNTGTKENHPINCVDWGQARTFAKWIGSDVDLPTEAEWEYAARGGQDYLYSGSDTASEVGWYISNSGRSTHPVGTLSANGFGLYDMSGNVWEWTLDEYHSSYTGAPSDGSVWGDLPTCNQVCDTGSAGRVFRGGSWGDDAAYLRVAFRGNYSPAYRAYFLGFRLRRTIP